MSIFKHFNCTRKLRVLVECSRKAARAEMTYCLNKLTYRGLTAPLEQRVKGGNHSKKYVKVCTRC